MRMRRRREEEKRGKGSESRNGVQMRGVPRKEKIEGEDRRGG